MPSALAAMLESSASDLESFVVPLEAAAVDKSDGLTVELRYVAGT